MADPKDIERTIEASDEDAISLRKQAVETAGGATRMKAPVDDVRTGLNPVLVNMLALGRTSQQFQGLERCIRIVDKGTPNQRHCLAMMVSNLTTNQKMCSSCDKIKDPNANPKIINSSMIRLTQRELEECGLKEDPLLNAKPEPVKPVKRLKEKADKTAQRRPKVAVPNSVKIEVTLKELGDNPQIVDVLLQKTLDAIFELPVKNFREAEEIRIVKERVEAFLSKGE